MKKSFFITIFFEISISGKGCFNPTQIIPENRNDRVEEMVRILDEPAPDSTVRGRKTGMDGRENDKDASGNSASFLQNK